MIRQLCQIPRLRCLATAKVYSRTMTSMEEGSRLEVTPVKRRRSTGLMAHASSARTTTTAGGEHLPSQHRRQDPGIRRTGPVFNGAKTPIILCRTRGLTVHLADLTQILRGAGYKGPDPQDYVLRRNRKEDLTYLTLEFQDAKSAVLAGRILSRAELNGAEIVVSAWYHPSLPPKYDPLHISPQSGPGKVVSIEGLPYLSHKALLSRTFAGYELVDNQDFQFHAVSRAADTSIWLVRTKSEDEAQRIVRNVNATYFQPSVHGRDYPLRAEVFY